jgi:hypothetical protein
MIIQRLNVFIKNEFSIDTLPMGDFHSQASINNMGELTVELVEVEWVAPDKTKRKPNGKVYVIRFNHAETQVIRSALGKGAQ